MPWKVLWEEALTYQADGRGVGRGDGCSGERGDGRGDEHGDGRDNGRDDGRGDGRGDGRDDGRGDGRGEKGRISLALRPGSPALSAGSPALSPGSLPATPPRSSLGRSEDVSGAGDSRNTEGGSPEKTKELLLKEQAIAVQGAELEKAKAAFELVEKRANAAEASLAALEQEAESQRSRRARIDDLEMEVQSKASELESQAAELEATKHRLSEAERAVAVVSSEYSTEQERQSRVQEELQLRIAELEAQALLWSVPVAAAEDATKQFAAAASAATATASALEDKCQRGGGHV